jgi:chromosome segregation ATPase
MATYMGRNVNLALLVIIIGVIVALVGTTVFFQRVLENKTDAYEDKAMTLGTCQIQLANYQETASEFQQQANQSAQDVRRYDDLYAQKVAELADAQVQLADTDRQRAFEKLQKERFQISYEQQLAASRTLNQTIVTLNKKINSLEDQLDACQG